MNGPQGVWRDLLHQISSSIEGTKQAKTIAEYLNVAPKETSDWQKFQLGVSEEALYDDDQLVTNILHSMVKLITCFHDSWIYEFFSRNFLCFVFLNFGQCQFKRNLPLKSYTSDALSFYRSQNVLGRSKFFVPDKKMM